MKNNSATKKSVCPDFSGALSNWKAKRRGSGGGIFAFQPFL
jgi:hypothetical protein